jgi:hypothetical protein
MPILCRWWARKSCPDINLNFATASLRPLLLTSAASSSIFSHVFPLAASKFSQMCSFWNTFFTSSTFLVRFGLERKKYLDSGAFFCKFICYLVAACANM